VLSLPGHETTTRHLASLYPWQAPPGLGSRGVLLGSDAYSHSAVAYDPWVAYEAGWLTGPNMAVFGRIGRGKSAFVKSYCYRQVGVFGRRLYVLDPKGEYHPLAQALALGYIRLGPNQHCRVNPLDPGPYGEVGPELVRRRSEMLTALVSAGLGRNPSPEERAALYEAANLLGRQGVMGDVVEMLLEPPPAMVARLVTGREELTKAVRDAALVLRRLVEGDLAGMFDGPTTAEIDWAGPGMVVDLSALTGKAMSEDALAAVMVCAGTWLSGAITAPGPPRLVVLDEAWALLRSLWVARWLQSVSKLARSTGTAMIFVAHRISDLLAAGAEGSETVRIALGLLEDAETRVIFSQPPGEVEQAKEMLGLSDPEADQMVELIRGRALWRVGSRSALVDHHLAGAELVLANTDEAMRSLRRE
jgi:hypothetical protein